MDIPAPPSSDDDRHIKCQMVVDGFIRELVDSAVSAGWQIDEVLSAIVEVADNQMLAAREDADLDALLKALRGKHE